MQDGATGRRMDQRRLDDGELKAEDGLVLDWQRDRTPMQPDGGPTFLEPISDELREIILRSVFYAAASQGLTLPVTLVLAARPQGRGAHVPRHRRQ